MQVLLVEDDDGESKILQYALDDADSGITTVVQSTLADGIAYLHTEKSVDAVLLDLGLPDSQGLDTLERVRSEFANMPVIVMTGWDNQTAAMDSIRMGAHNYLVKGKANGAQVAEAIRVAVERSEIEHDLDAKRTPEVVPRPGRAVLHRIAHESSMDFLLAKVKEVQSNKQQPVVVTVLNRHELLAERFEEDSDINMDAIGFVDCTGYGRPASASKNVVVVDSPTMMEAAILRAERMIRRWGPKAAVIVHTLDGFTLYSPHQSVAEFAHFLVNRMRAINVDCFLVTVDGATNGSLRDLMGGIIDLEDELS